MIASGSSNGTAMLIATDENTLRSWSRRSTRSESTNEDVTSAPKNSNGGANVPIYEGYGTPLQHGHGKEVTSISWTKEGNLVTCNDNKTARLWREDRNEARWLRERAVAEPASVVDCVWAQGPGDGGEVEGLGI